MSLRRRLPDQKVCPSVRGEFVKDFRFVAVTALLTSLTLLTTASSQTAATSSKAAPDAWMLTPTPYLEWNKDVKASVRAQRDRDEDKGAVGQKYPLTSPLSDAPGPGIGGGIPKTDIRRDPNRVVLTGTFTKHHAVLSSSEFSIQ